MELNLSKRLLNLLDNVDYSLGDILDIGSDHGLFCFYLAKNNYPFKIYASENKEGPFNTLKSQIEKYNLQDKVTPLFGDGFDVYLPNIKQVNISGMGGKTIIDIIDQGIKKKNIDVVLFILEPQKDQANLRRYLNQISYKCIKEYYIEEKNKIYPIMVYVKGKEEISNPLYYEFGRLPIINKDKILIKHLKAKLELYERLLAENKTEEALKIKVKTLKEILDLCLM